MAKKEINVKLIGMAIIINVRWIITNNFSWGKSLFNIKMGTKEINVKLIGMAIIIDVSNEL